MSVGQCRTCVGVSECRSVGVSERRSVGASKRRSVLEVIERIDVFPCQLGKSSTCLFGTA